MRQRIQFPVQRLIKKSKSIRNQFTSLVQLPTQYVEMHLSSILIAAPFSWMQPKYPNKQPSRT